MSIEWVFVAVVLLIYTSFVLDFLVWPVPSEVSTAALLNQDQTEQPTAPPTASPTASPVSSTASASTPVSLLLTVTAHAIVLLTWLYPLAYTGWTLYTLLTEHTATDGSPSVCSLPTCPIPGVTLFGLLVAVAGRCVTVAASLQLRKHQHEPDANDILTTGVFGRTRHPVVVGLHLTITGLLVATGQLYMALPLAVTFFYFEYKTRLEEDLLLQRTDIDYRRYQQQVSKYGW